MTKASPAPSDSGSGPLRGLSGKLLILTVAFVMLGEVLIFLPSMANFRIQWLKARLAQAEVATLATEAADGRRLDAALQSRILDRAGVLAITLQHSGAARTLTGETAAPRPQAGYDLRSVSWLPAIADAFDVLLHAD